MTDHAVNEWTRADLPRIGTPNPAHDSVVDGALDTVVHWLNASHPKPRPIDEAEFLDLYIDVIAETSGLERMVLWSHRVWAKKIVERLNAAGGVPAERRHGDVVVGGVPAEHELARALRERDQAFVDRDEAMDAESAAMLRAKSAEADRDRWRRAHEIVEGERDQARRERDEWKQEHDLLVVHGSVRGDTYAAMVRDRDDWRDKAYNASEGMRKAVARAEAAEARTAVTREDVEKVVHGSGGGFFDSRLDAIADAVCDLFGVEAGQATDPVEDKAREYLTVMFDYEEPDSASPAEWRAATQMARHVLGQEAGQ